MIVFLKKKSNSFIAVFKNPRLLLYVQIHAPDTFKIILLNCSMYAYIQGGTFGGSAIGCAVVSATVDTILEEKLLENA